MTFLPGKRLAFYLVSLKVTVFILFCYIDLFCFFSWFPSWASIFEAALF